MGEGGWPIHLANPRLLSDNPEDVVLGATKTQRNAGKMKLGQGQQAKETGRNGPGRRRRQTENETSHREADRADQEKGREESTSHKYTESKHE